MPGYVTHPSCSSEGFALATSFRHRANSFTNAADSIELGASIPSFALPETNQTELRSCASGCRLSRRDSQV